MSRIRKSPRRLVVVSVAIAASVGGFGAASLQSAGAISQPVTGNSISPTSDSETATNVQNGGVGHLSSPNPANGVFTSDNMTCNPFLLQTTPNQATSLGVQITQAAVQNADHRYGADPTTQIGFCDPTDFVRSNDGTGGTTVHVDPLGGLLLYQNQAGTRQIVTNPNSTLSKSFCPAVTYATSNNPTAHCTGYFPTDTKGQVEIGVTSNEPGPMTVTVFSDTNHNAAPDTNASEYPASAAKTWVANDASSVSCDPTDSSDPTYHMHAFQCAVTTAAGTGAIGQPVRFQFQQNSDPDAGNVLDLVQRTCAENDEATSLPGFRAAVGQYGVYDCAYTNDGGEGTDHISVFDDQNNNLGSDSGEPNQSLTETWGTASPDNAFLTLTCGNNTYVPQHNGTVLPCENEPAGKAVTVTAQLTRSQGGPSLAGHEVDFLQCDLNLFGGNLLSAVGDAGSVIGPVLTPECTSDSAGNLLGHAYHPDQDAFSPASTDAAAFGLGNGSVGKCITDPNGACQTTLTHGLANEGDFSYILGIVSIIPPAGGFDPGTPSFCLPNVSGPGDGGCYYTSEDEVLASWHLPNSNVDGGDEARNVTITPTSSSGAERYTVHTTDRFGNNTMGSCVGFLLQGAGRFTNAVTDADQFCGSQSNADSQQSTFDTTCITNASGLCTVETTRDPGETGGQVVVASILTDASALDYRLPTSQHVTVADCEAPAGETYYDNTYPYLAGFGATADVSQVRQELLGVVSSGDLLGLPTAPAGNCTTSSDGTIGSGPGSGLGSGPDGGGTGGGGGSNPVILVPLLTSASPSPATAGGLATVTGTGSPYSFVSILTFDHHSGGVVHHNVAAVGGDGTWSWQFQPAYSTIVEATSSSGSQTTGASNMKVVRVVQTLNIVSNVRTKHKHGTYFYRLRGYSPTQIPGETISVMRAGTAIGSARMHRDGTFTVRYQLPVPKKQLTLHLRGDGRGANGLKYSEAATPVDF